MINPRADWKFTIFPRSSLPLAASPRLFDRGWFSLGCSLRQSSTCNQFASATDSRRDPYAIRLLHPNYALCRNYTRYRERAYSIFSYFVRRRFVTRRFNVGPHTIKGKPLSQSAYRKFVIGCNNRFGATTILIASMFRSFDYKCHLTKSSIIQVLFNRMLTHPNKFIFSFI